MMPYIEQDQITHAAAFKAELIGVLNPVDPRIRKYVGREALRQHRFDIAESRTQLYRPSIHVSADSGRDLAIEALVDSPQPRLPVPILAILMDLDVMLFERRSHGLQRLRHWATASTPRYAIRPGPSPSPDQDRR